MIISYSKVSGVFFALANVILLLNGCATMGPKHTVKPGEEVGLRYTCRLKGDGIVATTDKDVADDPSREKSRLFAPLKDYEVPVLVAGSGRGGPLPLGNVQPFVSEIGAQLTRAIVGLELDKEHRVEIASKMQMGLTEKQRFLTLSRIRRDKPKELRMSYEEYRAAYGKEPVVGQEAFSLGPAMAKVLSVEDTDVVIRLSIEEGGTIDIALGKAVYHNKGDRFDIVIEAHVGDLLRMGWLVGRVSEVNDTTMTIDFGHPFGGETLVCDVLAESPEDQADKNADEALAEFPEDQAEKNIEK
ncbi:MAG: hypothetical protein SWQ30_14555 [Thermodesulfobacteriota bacterium]|nr:hypothetical protein [Thermodesulfobacteriota bacterium]